MKRHSWRECEIRIVWRMYIAGKELKEIAARLHRSENSIGYCLATWNKPQGIRSVK